MTKLLHRGTATLNRLLKRAGSFTVDIYDGDDAIEGVEVNAGRSEFGIYNMDEFAGTAKMFDWIVLASDLEFFDGVRIPVTGWEIWYTLPDETIAVYIVTAGGEGRAYEVMTNEGAQDRLMYRIHSKLDRIEPAP